MSCFSKSSVKIQALNDSIITAQELTCIVCHKNKNIMTLTCNHNYCVNCFKKCKYCIKCEKLNNKRNYRRNWCWCCK